MSKEPFGPLDIHDKLDQINLLIGKNVLYSNHKDGLGNWGVLVSVHPELSYPYRVLSETPPFPRKLYTRWIVEQ